MMYYVFWCPVHPKLKPKGAPMSRIYSRSLMPSAPQFGIAPISSLPPNSPGDAVYIYMSSVCVHLIIDPIVQGI